MDPLNTPAQPVPPAPSGPLRTLRHVLAPVLWMIVLLALVIVAAAGAIAWLARSEAGTRWLLVRLPGVQASGVQGALLSADFAVERLHVAIGSKGRTITIEGLQAQGLTWSWRPDASASAWVGVDALHLRARRVRWVSGPATHGGPPRTLGLPLHAVLADVEVGELLIDNLAPQRQLRARGELGAAAGKEHRIEALSFAGDRVRADVAGRIATARPFALALTGQLKPLAQNGAPWLASVQASGPLELFNLNATLRGQASAGHAAPALDLRAAIRPFADWPLATLSASTQSLDLATLSSLAPQTQLSGSAEIVTTAAEAPISAEIKLDNAVPGRWEQKRLPLKRIEMSLRASAKARGHVDLSHVELWLATGAAKSVANSATHSANDATADAGRWRGSGQWRADALQLETQIVALRPQLLDARAPALTVSGPLNVIVRGLPGPEAALGSRANSANSAIGAAGAVGATPAKTPLTVEVNGTLDGRLDATPQPVRVQLEALLSAQRLELRQFRASAGSALAQGRALAEMTASGLWTVKSDGTLADFDPLLWWPGNPGSAWRLGPHRFSGAWQLDLKLPANPQRLAPLQLAQTTAGSGVVHVRDSLLAGVPVQLDMTLGHTPGAANLTPNSTPSSLRGELRLGGNNRLSVDGNADPLGSGSSDRWRVELKAEALASLAATLRLFPELAPWAPRGGTAEAQIQGTGRWPDVRSEGQAKLDRAHLGELQVRRGQLTWQLDTSSDQPLNIQADVQGLRLERQQIDTLHADLQGTLRQHVLRAQVVLPVKPPQWTETVLGLSSGSGTRAQLQAEGSWAGDASGGGSWRGRIAEISVGPWDADGQSANASANASTNASARTSPPSSWFDGRDLRTELLFSPRGGLIDLRADAGQARIADTLTLRWDAVHLDRRSERADFSLRAQIEPFLAAPMLARLQPALGWSGDLRLAATLDVKAAENFDADVVFEHRGGDLLSTDSAGRHALGLSALRVALSAHDGRWSFTQALSGRTLGELKGDLTLRTAARQRWPDAQTAISGTIEARAADIGIWSAWVPPGWRLTGSLTANANVSGRLGAREYTGRMQGRDIGVRNLLQGVNVSGGDVSVVLSGATAQIERFALQGGDGILTVSGNADLGDKPAARLQLQAERFRVLGRVDRQLVASGRATLLLQPDLLKLDGALKIDEGLIDVTRSDAPALDSDVVLRSGEATTQVRTSAEPAKPAKFDAQVAMQVDLGNKLRVRGRGLDTMLGGELRISTPRGRLALHGVVSAVGGTYAAYAQKLDIDRGILSFSGAPENPNLDILALRPNIDARVGVAIGGSFLVPRVRLYSDPEMSDTDKLSWLVLGRPGDGLGRADSALLQRAALALLAGEGEAPTDAFLRTIGLDELSLRQSDGEVRETVISVGKQLSRRWYLGYERGVNATTGTWQLIYRIAQRFTLRAQSGNENALDLIWVWRVGDAALLPAILPQPSPVRKSPTPTPATPP